MYIYIRSQCNFFRLELTCILCCFSDTKITQLCVLLSESCTACIWSTSSHLSFFVFVCVFCNCFRPMIYIYIYIRYLQPGVLSQEPSTCRNCRVGYNEVLVFSIIYIYIYIYLFIYIYTHGAGSLHEQKCTTYLLVEIDFEIQTFLCMFLEATLKQTNFPKNAQACWTLFKIGCSGLFV